VEFGSDIKFADGCTAPPIGFWSVRLLPRIKSSEVSMFVASSEKVSFHSCVLTQYDPRIAFDAPPGLALCYLRLRPLDDPDRANTLTPWIVGCVPLSTVSCEE